MRSLNRIHCLAALSIVVASIAPAACAQKRETHPQTPTGASFRLVSAQATEGFVPMTAPDGQTVHVSSRELFTGRDVLALRVGRTDNGETIELSLPARTADILTNSVRTGNSKLLGVVSGKKLVAVATVDVGGGPMPKLTGLGKGQADQISRLVKMRATPNVSTVVTVVPRQKTGKPGDVLTAETKPGKTWEKESKRAGKLMFSESVTEYRDQNGELVITATGVGVRTERPVDS